MVERTLNSFFEENPLDVNDFGRSEVGGYKAVALPPELFSSFPQPQVSGGLKDCFCCCS